MKIAVMSYRPHAHLLSLFAISALCMACAAPAERSGGFARADALVAAPTTGNVRALAPRLEFYAADLLALRAGAAMSEDPFGAEQLADRVLRSILTMGDGSSESPWTVSSRGDALAVLTAEDREVVGGHHHTSANGALIFRLLARSDVGGRVGNGCSIFLMCPELSRLDDQTPA